jgi:hypothetical protein
MTSGQRLTQATNHLGAKSSILEARDRLAEFQRAEAARRQAPAVINALSGLDPQNDPDYDVKRMQILSQAPEAAMDATVARFLGVQDDVYNRSTQMREAEASQQAQWDRMMMTDKLMRSRAQESEQRRLASIEKELEARKRATQQAKFEELPEDAQQAIMDRVEFGESPDQAMKAERERQAQQQEINDLYEMGFLQADIKGKEDQPDRFPGILDENGNIDPEKKAQLIGRAKARKEAEEQSNREMDKLKSRVAMLQELVDNATDDDTDKPKWESQLAEAKKSLLGMVEKPAAAPEPAPTGTQPAPATPSSGGTGAASFYE